MSAATTKRIFAFFFIFIVKTELVLSAITGTGVGEGNDAEPERVPKRMLRSNSNTNNSERPVMHTFYAKILGESRTGMSDEEDRKLLEAWSSAWRAAGWDTRVLGIEDAMKYKEFKVLDDVITPHVNNEYNKFCFYRWMAMAALDNGGFMADYDTFPLPSSKAFAPRLPHDGHFTVYDPVPKKGGVPSLMSGSKAEWIRMTTAITKKMRDPDNSELVTTDMLSLMALDRNKDDEHYDLDKKVVPGLFAVGVNRPWDDKCEEYKGFYAVHYAHTTIVHGIRNGVFPKSTRAADRGPMVSDLLRKWAQRCGVYEFPSIESQ